MAKKAPKPTAWQNRIIGHGEEAPDQLLANPKNWRVHPKNQQDALGGVLREVGVVQSVIVNEQTGHLVDGHLRVALALREGQPTIPVVYVDLSEEEEAKVLATIDPVAAMAGVDQALLDNLLAEVQTQDAGLQALLDEMAGKEDQAPKSGLKDGVDPDAVPEPPKVPITQPGDLWILGRHRLLCGDSTKAEDVARLMDGAKADMVFTDPPYGVSIVKGATVGGSKPFGSKDKRGTVGASNMVKANSYAPIIGDETTETAINAYQLCADLEIPVLIFWGGNYYANALPPSSCWIVWDKDNTGNFADAELAWTNLERPVRLFQHRWNGMIKASEHGQKRVHPTQKPVALAEWTFQEYGKPGDKVLDLFGGSGSTLIACEATGRACYMMEMSPDYCDVIVKRWEDATGQKAERHKGGER